MTVRQQIVKFFYPLLMYLNKLSAKNAGHMRNTLSLAPPVSFYSLEAEQNNGRKIYFSEWKGKKVLLVNTASACGYTPQYAELQSLYDQFRDKLIILGFPSNDFGAQEKGSDEAIAAFCTSNYGINFPLAKKSMVVKGAGQNKVFEWLTNKDQNGWNDRAPEWNFSKYLVDEKGALIHCFKPGISPLAGEVMDLLKQ
jgi:glutathione peroxidase